MGKNIVVLTGSPRKGGNSDRMADAFIRGAQEAGHTAVKIETAALDVKGCRACDGCYRGSRACFFNDDFNSIAQSVLEADAVVVATPLYWFSFPAQIKNVIDKFYAFVVGGKEFKNKECALLTCGGDSEEKAFDGLVRSYELIAEYLGWKDRGRLVLTGVNAKGDIEKTDGLVRAEKMGAEF